MATDYINKNCPVYLSYAWANDTHPDIEKDVENLCALLDEKGIYFKREKDIMLPYRSSIIDAEKEIGEGSTIIIVFSDRYLKSLHCMYEWHMIRKNGKLQERVFPIVLDDARITNHTVFEDYLTFFKEREEELLNQQREGIIPLTRIEKETINAGSFIDDLKYLYHYLRNHIYCRRDNYDELIEQLKTHFKRICKYSSTCDETAPHFSLFIPDGLILRDTVVESLNNLISLNRVVNLVGVGGSGKSSLAYLLLDKYKDDFNEIAFVVVNNNIKDDFVNQLNLTLKLDFEGNGYKEVISYLQDNYKSEKPNLLVFDINETSDRDKNNELFNEIIKSQDILAGWKLLILSRENIDTRNRIVAYNLNENEDVEFLKKLFLSKSGERYNDFGDFSELCKVIFFNPLLAEQLGLYLNDYPKTANLDLIKKILYGDSFREEEMQGTSARQHDENVNSFLKNLIVFDKLDTNEEKLLRHFALWKAEYIGYDVIEDLLKDVFESEDELINTLKSLSKRSILATNNGKTLSFKLHGLLANSLREQIDIQNEDYEVYLNNIERIIKYSYNQFLPYIDCIGNSLCEYDIITNPALINAIAIKYYNVLKDNYAEQLYYKAIEIAHNRLSSNPEYHSFGLVKIYNNLAILQINHLKDYKSAELNINKALEICNRLPKDNLKYQTTLAELYKWLAIIQSDNLRDYQSAEVNFYKSIDIREQLPYNPEYLNGLASSYRNLAIFQEKYLGEFESAATNLYRAIEIRENLPQDNIEYQKGLARAYNNLAMLQCNHFGNYESALSNYNKTINIYEALPKDNSEYQNNLARVYNNLANLQRFHFKQYDSAIQNYEKAIAIREELPKDNPEYQNGLAMVYNNLAFLQYSILENYETAQKNNEIAKSISEHLSKDNPNYQSVLAFTYNTYGIILYKTLKDYSKAILNINYAIDIAKNLIDKDAKYLIYWITYNFSLAEIYFDNKEIEKAKNLLTDIQPMAKKCLTENSYDGWTIWINQTIDELIQRIAVK